MSGHLVIFDPNLISSKLITNKGNTLLLNVYTNEEFQKKIKRVQTWTMALTVLAAGLNAATAGRSTSYSTSYSNGYAYTTVTNTYNHEAASQASIVSSIQMMTLRKMMEEDKIFKEQGYFKKTTIHPDEGVSGYMNIKRKKGKLLTVNVHINGHTYSFDWNIAKRK